MHFQLLSEKVRKSKLRKTSNCAVIPYSFPSMFYLSLLVKRGEIAYVSRLAYTKS